MSEDSIIRSAGTRAVRRGAWFIKTTGVSLVGCPDWLICYRGRLGAIEWKQHPNKPTPKQLRQLELIRRAGGVTLIGYRPEDADRLLDAIDWMISLGGELIGGHEVPAQPTPGPDKEVD